MLFQSSGNTPQYFYRTTTHPPFFHPKNLRTFAITLHLTAFTHPSVNQPIFTIKLSWTNPSHIFILSTMKILKFLLSFAALGGLVFALNNTFNVKGVPVPAVGKLLSPFEGYWANGEKLTAAPNNETLKGLKGDVKVVYDDRAIPHIFAQTIEDAYFVQGYLHAQHRLWQMDMASRAMGGRLSEVLGDRPIRAGMTTVDVDKNVRRRGILASAEKMLPDLEADGGAPLQAYIAGVNSYIGKLEYKDYPIEYKIFGVAPEPWTALKSLLITKYMANNLASRDNDVQATNARTLFGKDFDAVYPEYFKEQSPIVPTGTPYNIAPAANAKAAPLSLSAVKQGEMLPYPEEFEFLKPDAGWGSNNWAVSGSKTLSKRPILCGDPHLALTLPAIWYECQISTPEQNAYGVSIPGTPSVVIGFNDHIAWSQTNVGYDIADWYSLKWANNEHSAYMLDGKATPVKIRVEKIMVKGVGEVLDTVKYTVFGPVVTENDTMPNASMAYRWLANEVPCIHPSVFVKLNKAKNYDEYVAAIAGYNVPAQNYAFASKDGDIALRVQGLFPIQTKGEGRFVQDGTVSPKSWKAFIAADKVPAYRNPARGFVASANQHSTDPNFPNYYHSEGFEAYRGRTLNTFLSKMDSITVDDMKKLQFSNFSLKAAECIEMLKKQADPKLLDATGKPLFDEIVKWDGNYTADSKVAVMFELFMEALHQGTWDEVYSRNDAARLLKPAEWRTIFLLRDEPNSKFFDNIGTTDKKETGKDIIAAAFKKAAAEMVKAQAEMATKSPADPTLTWGNYKDSEIPHISRIPGLGKSIRNLGGSKSALNAMSKDAGPSWRMIVEMGADRPRAQVVYPGGQSGNPGNKNYDDFVETWRKGEYYEAVFLQKADEGHARLTNVQVFKPM
jgi:penicillin G amidase